MVRFTWPPAGVLGSMPATAHAIGHTDKVERVRDRMVRMLGVSTILTADAELVLAWRLRHRCSYRIALTELRAPDGLTMRQKYPAEIW